LVHVETPVPVQATQLGVLRYFPSGQVAHIAASAVQVSQSVAEHLTQVAAPPVTTE
jgi:hypothetical protein